jgi:hypothetical protein
MDMNEKPSQYSLGLVINGLKITTILIGRHYLKKHGASINDALILELVLALNGSSFPVDSSTDGIEYYVADIRLESTGKIYRIIWLFEGANLEILGVINAYRRKKTKR